MVGRDEPSPEISSSVRRRLLSGCCNAPPSSGVRLGGFAGLVGWFWLTRDLPSVEVVPMREIGRGAVISLRDSAVKEPACWVQTKLISHGP